MNKWKIVSIILAILLVAIWVNIIYKINKSNETINIGDINITKRSFDTLAERIPVGWGMEVCSLKDNKCFYLNRLE